MKFHFNASLFHPSSTSREDFKMVSQSKEKERNEREEKEYEEAAKEFPEEVFSITL